MTDKSQTTAQPTDSHWPESTSENRTKWGCYLDYDRPTLTHCWCGYLTQDDFGTCPECKGATNDG